jgi:tRNA threonylcarbamoyladenosine biosynthesis protein TsaE
MARDSMAIDLADEAATAKLGQTIAATLGEGDVVALEGGLGAGKTTLARAIIGALCGAQETPSPTFTLVQTYPGLIRGRPVEVWHFDLYRLKRAEEAYDLAIEDALASGISLIEWPEKLGALLPERRLLVELSITGARSRLARLQGGAHWQEAIRAIDRAMSP